MPIKKLTTCLWFDKNGEDAVNFYTGIFKNSKILKTVRWGDEGPGEKGSVLTMSFMLDDVEFLALNGGPEFKFTEAVSLIVNCEDQQELDYYWDKLLEGGGKPSQCGWLKDKFGFSWQVTPVILGELLQSPDKEKADRVMKAMMGMVKLDIPALEAAGKG